jgi:hypothetical protein
MSKPFFKYRLTVAIFFILLIHSYSTIAGKYEPAPIPRQAEIAMLQFQDALEQGEWAKVLSFCSEEVKAGAKQWGSLDTFFRETVPVDIVLKMRTFPYHSTRRAKESSEYFLYIPLTEPNFAPTILWDCSLQQTGDLWRVNFKPEAINLQDTITAERKRLADQKETLNKARKEMEPKLRGLKTHLSTVSDEFVIGEPMLFRLELMNYGEHTLHYDAQQVAVNASMVVLDRQNQSIPYIAGPYQTAGGFKELKPDSTVVLFDNFYISKQYDISKPGMYWIQFSGKGLDIGQSLSPGSAISPPGYLRTTTQFPSNRLRIEVKEQTSD